MSVLFKTESVSLIDHGEFINNLYKDVEVTEQETRCYSLDLKLFYIKSIHKPVNKKRKHDIEELLKEVSSVRAMYENFLQEVSSDIKSFIIEKYNLLETGEVRDLANHLCKSTVFDHSGISGGNNSDKPLNCKIKGDNFLIPSHSRFLCGCVKEQCLKLAGNKYDLLIADPPWWNKFIRRLRNANDKLSYKMMYNEEIASIPIKDLLSENCLVAVWCTNSPANISAVKDIIFPSWGVTYITTWYWLKVTIELEPICSFGTGHHKQPYERLMLGKAGKLKKEPETHLFMSVPSALHSHKPPLLDLLKPYVDRSDPQVLELFARYLLPNTTSVGYEPLKWQHISLFETVS